MRPHQVIGDHDEAWLVPALLSVVTGEAEREAMLRRLSHDLETCGTTAGLQLARVILLFAAELSDDTSLNDTPERHQRRVLTYLIRLVEQGQDVPTLHAIFQICEPSAQLSGQILEHCSACINLVDQSKEMWSSSTSNRASSYEVKPSSFPNHSKQIVLNWLCFIQVYAWVSTAHDPRDTGSMLLQVISVIRHEDTHTSSQATATAVALISRPKANSHGSRRLHEPLPTDIWKAVRELASSPWQCSLVVPGLTLWLRGLSRFSDAVATLGDDAYQSLLRLRLSEGTKEQQKLAVAILRLTVNQMEVVGQVPVARHYVEDFTKYATLYEGIVLTGYLNQVIEMLPDLTSLVISSSTVGLPWIIALLRAALASSAQYSIRRAVGQWILKAPPSLVADVDSSTICPLLDAFLPWATLGTFFTSSIRHDEPEYIVCRHGEDLIAFLLRAILASTSPYAISNAILDYLIVQQNHISSFARIYLIEGVVCAMKHNCITEEETSKLLTVASTTGFLEIACDLATMLCSSLLGSFPTSSQVSGQVEHLKARQRQLQDIASEEAFSDYSILFGKSQTDDRSDLETFAVRLEKMQCQYISGAGLLAACTYVQGMLDTSNKELVESGAFRVVLDSIWDEVEIQEFPRAALLRLPNIILHPHCLSIASSQDELRSKIRQQLAALSALATNRIHVFAALAQGWRQAVQEVPDAAIQFPLLDFLLTFAQRPPVAKVEFEMEAVLAVKLNKLVPSRGYETYYGRNQACAYACMLDLLNSMPRDEAYHSIAIGLLDKLLRPWCIQARDAPVFSPWKSTTQLQVMLLLSERCSLRMDKPQLSTLVDRFLDILVVELLPRYRHLLEWIIVRLLYRLPDRRWDLLTFLGKPDLRTPKNILSHMRILLMIASMPDIEKGFAVELATHLVLLAASAKVAVRHEAQWIFPQLWDICDRREWKLDVNPVFSRMNEHIRGMEVFKNPPTARLQGCFDPVRDHNLTYLVEGPYMDIEPPETPKLRRADLSAVWQDDHQACAYDVEPLMALGEPKTARRRAHETAQTTSAASAPDMPEPSINAPHQTKNKTKDSTATFDMESFMSSLPSLADLDIANNPSHSRRPTSLILIASLITNPHNLGGLSRISEILGAAEMHVHSLTPTSTKEFTSVSVSSHIHLPIHCLPTSDVPTFLTAKKLEGYEIVGVEQTDRSKVLGEETTMFRKDGKTVLVLGSEREGIPGALLADVDWCIEVQQDGVTRSMNVQTAAAVVLHEYARQRRSTQRSDDVGLP